MGVGPGGPPGGRGAAAAGGAWLVATALSVGGGPLPPPVLGLGLALVGAALALGDRAPMLSASLLAAAATPAWLLGAGVLDTPGAPSPGGASAALLLLALGLAVAAPGALPRGVRMLVVAMGLVLGLRAWLVAPVVPAALWGVGPLVCGGMIVAGAAALPRSHLRPGAATLALALILRLGMAWGPWASPPRDAAAVARTAAVGALSRHTTALAERPALGLLALAQRPEAHPVALALAPRLGIEPLLDAGWRPEGALLAPTQRLALSLSLDRRGRGGEALRLAWAGRAAPEVAWAWLLLARDQGLVPADQTPAPSVDLDAPAFAPRLPGRIALDWSFLTAGARQLDLHLDVPLPALSLEVRGQGWQGPALLSVQVDAASPRLIALPEGADTLSLPGPWAAGPHRLRVRFENDAAGADGDRNAWVDALSGGGSSLSPRGRPRDPAPTSPRPAPPGPG